MLLHPLQYGVLLLTITRLSIQTSAVDSEKYIGAVVEYHPLSDGDDLRAILEANAKNYQTIIKKAAEYRVDIIVFPEYGLTRLPPKEGEERYDESKFRAFYQNVASYVPNPNETVVLCDANDKYAKSLQMISCAAREYGMYVVVNHHERADCPRPNCSPDNFLLYNTNVVFDRKGKVIARYRKSTLYQEDGTNVTETPEYSIFRTDFGVTFGQLICADLLFEEPAIFYANNPEVTDVIFSTRWFDQAPFIYATETQAAWAYAADVNFLASCYSNASTHSSGSGIYAGKSGSISVYRRNSKSSNALIIAEIPKLNRQKCVDVSTFNSTVYEFVHGDVPTVTDPPINPINGSSLGLDDLRLYSTQLVDPNQGSQNTTLCDRGLCCEFHIEMTHNPGFIAEPGIKQYRYRMVAFSGMEHYDTKLQPSLSLEICALINCIGDTLDNCESFYSPEVKEVSATRLDSLTITRSANLTERSLYMPMTLTRDYVPLTASNFAYSQSGPSTSTLLRMHLERARTDLLVFGIFGRRYDRYGQDPMRPSAKVERD